MQTVLNHPLFMPILVTLVIIGAFPLVAGYIVLVERKVLADFQVRLGPMPVGPPRLLQPIADALKLLLKEDIIPEQSDKAIFWFAPCISTITALTAFAVIPFGKAIFVAGAWAAPLRASNVPVNVLAGSLVTRRLSLRYVRALRRLLVHGRYDVVHAHLYASAAAAAAAAPRNTPLVLTEHTEGPWRSWRARAVSRWFYRRASHIVAVSTAIRNVLVDAYHVPPARIEVLPAIPALPLRPDAPPPGGERSAVVGFAGQLTPEKGADVFLRAASLVARVVPEARFVVIGDGLLRRELEALAGDLGLPEESVRFLGFRDDAADLIAGLDILAVPSRSDGRS